ncbi:CCR4-NOT transcription complex subunit 1 [Zea mays]|uniref:CCR4-NOT transcription complex subunit 1 n=1 Tax=Zea mays TaxID=4577 RepID=A0A317YI64_MAIZE|nr:CCR4-NOT transcription complex subunit 1 [Zea mays]
MIPVSADVAAELRLLFECATDSNFDSIRREICQLVDSGLDGCILVLRVCLNQVLLNAGEVKNLQLQLQQRLLSDVFRYCLRKTCFTTSFCEVLTTIALTDDFLESLSNLLELSVAEKIGVGLALSDSENSEIKQKGQWFSIAQIEELCMNPIQSVSNDQIHEIVVFLHQYDGLLKHLDTLNNVVSLLKVTERPFFAPVTNGDFDRQPNLSRHLDMYLGSTNDDFESLLSEIGKEISMADIVAELGYGCTVDNTRCKEILSIVEPLDDVAISKLLGAVVGTHSGLGDAHNRYATFVSAILNSHTNDSSQLTKWNADVLVDSINELAPSTNWVRVMEYLDHEGFNIPDETGFYLLMSIYTRACKDPFPLHAVCGSLWKNREGQISFLKHAVSASPDKFTFAHSSRHLEFQDLAGPSQGNHAWSCLDLLEVLCQLAEVGYATSVRSMLEYPLGHCPELLLVGVSHVTTVYNLLQYEVLSCIFPALLKDPTKHNVMNYLWHTNPYFTLRGFVDAHSDPDCLLRTVDVCHDLKILSSVLDSTPFAFSIKLAAAALRKDYSHLEKWLTEKLSLYGKGFVEECVDFLKATMSNTDNVLEGMSQPQSIVKNLYWESCCVFIKVLQSHSGQLLSDVILDEIKKLCALYESRKPSSVVRELTNSEGGSDDIEVEANAYFQHMFSGQISVDSMIQMLGRFKESTNKREVSIFDCMISNLFEEYKFFPKYPDKQLKIAAVLFVLFLKIGSLIKHQLVAHLALGIALRGVLDSLRKSVDSKMFMFGTTALEQFMDRVIEWPQYCNHILQISHLRGTHFEMVSAIERALAKISSSQNEPNVGNLLSAEQHVSSSSSMEGTEVSESSWLMGTIPSQLGRPLSSPLQHRQQGLLGERSKISMSTLNKNIVSSQPPLVSSSADLTIPKTTATPSLLASPHQSTSVSTSLHTGFLRSRSTSGLPRQPSYTTGFGTALNIETLVAAAEQRDTPIETPPPEVQDKILFMINNISISNMEAKAKEFNEVIQEKYYPWFAQYMVMKRASIEPNFHDLYLKFFDKVNSKSLNKEILKATYENCKVLLRSDLIKSSSEERSLLKNLGSWLGKFTIGRNQALRAKEIDPKSLIVEAYEKGLMIAVIPFTSKILEPCQSSIAYRPPNPWTMGILSLLAEIYNLPNLKMNLKFDIEVLFKNLTVDIKDVKPTSLLKDRLREVEGNPDFSNKDVTASQTPVVAEVPSGTIPSLTHMEQQPEINITSRAMSLPNILNQYAAPVRLPTNSTVEDDKVALMMPEQVPSLTQLMAAIPREEIRFKINPKLGSLGPQLQYSKIMDLALDKANREIILPVIQRSVTIASRTTKELILKDYALESDNNTITRSAHLMVGTLAGSLAHVTCKEPLRVALYSNLRNLIQNLMSGSETIEQLIHTLINDNLDLGCAIIEAVATRQAVELIDVEIAQPFSQQRKQREAGGPAYHDTFAYAQGPFARVPEALRPKPGHLSASQQRVYEDFVHVWHPHSQNVGATGSGLSGGATVSSTLGVPRAYSPNSAPVSSINLSTIHMSGLTSITQPMELGSEEPVTGIAQFLSNPAQVGVSESSVLLGGTIGAASNDLPVSSTTVTTNEITAMVPPPSTSAADRLGSILPELLNTGDALERYQQVAQKLEALIANDGKDVEIQSVIMEVPDILRRCVSRDEAALAVAQKVFKSLYDNTSNTTYVSWLLATLVAIRDVCKLVVKELTSWVIYSDEEKKFNIDIIFGLIRSELLNIGEYNVHLAKLIDGGRNIHERLGPRDENMQQRNISSEVAVSDLRTLESDGGTLSPRLLEMTDDRVLVSPVKAKQLKVYFRQRFKNVLNLEEAGAPNSVTVLPPSPTDVAAADTAPSEYPVSDVDAVLATPSGTLPSSLSDVAAAHAAPSEASALDVDAELAAPSEEDIPATTHAELAAPSEEDIPATTHAELVAPSKDPPATTQDSVEICAQEQFISRLSNQITRVLPIPKSVRQVATEFAMSLVQALFAHDPVGFTEFQNVLDALSKHTKRPGSPESLQQLIEIARNNVSTTTGFVAVKDEKVLATRANKEENTANEITLVDPNQVAVLFSEWCQMCNHLQQDGLLKGDDISERFFRILTELAVTHSLVSEQIVAPGGSSQQSPQQPHISYFSIDSYAKLVVMVLKYSVEITPNKASILSKILSVTVRSIQKDAEEKKASFNPRPYFRLFINWLYDLTTTDGHHDSSNFQVLTAFANAFHMLQPLRVPAWRSVHHAWTFLQR